MNFLCKCKTRNKI